MIKYLIIISIFMTKQSIFILTLVCSILSSSFLHAGNMCIPQSIIDSYDQKSSSDSTSESSDKSDGFVFIDQTLSMEGFVLRDENNIAEEEYNYLKAMDQLPFQLSLITSNQAFHKYSNDIETISTDELFTATSSDFYNCPASVPQSDCRNLQSDLESVLNIAAMNPEGFYVIVTDLFLKNTQFFDPKSSIKKSLATVFDQNQSIGIYGVKSKFNGRVSGLPSGGVYEDANSRAFFIITIGKKNEVLEFKNNLELDVFASVNEEDKNFTIYTNDFVLNTVSPKNIKKTDLYSGNGAEKNNFLSEEYNLHQFNLNRKHDPLIASFDLYGIQIPNTILLSDFTTDVTLWQSKDASKCNKWQRFEGVPKLVKVTQDSNIINIETFGKNNEAASKFKKKRYYLANIKIIANDIGLNNKDFWLNDWSFTSIDEAEIVQTSPVFFPTLNLSKFSTMLSNIQKSEFKSIIPIEFNVAVVMN